MSRRKTVRRAAGNLPKSLEYLRELLCGQYYLLKFRLRGQKVVVGRRFRVVGGVDIRGPGTVVFGDDCVVFSTKLARTTPWTQSPAAVIKFGNQVALNGARISCAARIEVGDRAMLAEARITDSDFHAVQVGPEEHRLNTQGATKPVYIGANAWVCVGAIVLKGTRIGANTVVAAGSVVTGRIPSDVVVFGNPARVVWRFPRGTSPRGPLPPMPPA